MDYSCAHKPGWYWAGDLAGPDIIHKTIVEVYLSGDGELLVYIDDGERHDLWFFDVWSDQPILRPEGPEVWSGGPTNKNKAPHRLR